MMIVRESMIYLLIACQFIKKRYLNPFRIINLNDLKRSTRRRTIIRHLNQIGYRKS